MHAIITGKFYDLNYSTCIHRVNKISYNESLNLKTFLIKVCHESSEYTHRAYTLMLPSCLSETAFITDIQIIEYLNLQEVNYFPTNSVNQTDAVVNPERGSRQKKLIPLEGVCQLYAAFWIQGVDNTYLLLLPAFYEH